LAGLAVDPTKRWGQNFLADSNLAKAIVNNLAVRPGEQVVEIGPGLGALTDLLLAAGAQLTAIEIDRRLADDLQKRLDPAVCRVVEADAVQFDYGALAPLGPVSLIGNLPYSASTAIIAAWLNPAMSVRRAVAMVQREVAERLAASHDTRDYGGLSVRVQLRYQVRIERIVPPTVFKPAPKVDSAVIIMEPHPPGTMAPFKKRTMDVLLRAGFSQRRKQLGKLFASVGLDWAAASEALNLPKLARAEDLKVSDWVALARWRDGMGQVVKATDGEWFDVVDAEDRATGRMQRAEVHAQGLRHRAVHIFITDTAGRILLQRRSDFKDKFPGIWDSSAAGHVGAGDDYAATAEREIEEELGVKVPLLPVGRVEACLETGMEFVEIFHGRHDGPFEPDPEEVAALRFFDRATLEDWIRRRPEDFAPGLLRCWQEVSSRIPED